MLYHPDSALNRELELANTSYGSKGSINIYELAHKCKEWAFNQSYIMESAYVTKGNFTSSYCKLENHFIYPKVKETFHEDTEIKAIFKTCQWILDNKDKG